MTMTLLRPQVPDYVPSPCVREEQTSTAVIHLEPSPEPMTSAELVSLTAPWAFFVSCSERQIEAEPALRVRYARESRVAVRFLRGQRCESRERLYQEFAAALQFPWYFGANLDALDECINDLSWLPAEAYILILTNCDRILPDGEANWRVLCELLSQAAVTWVERDAQGRYVYEGGQVARATMSTARFAVIFHCAPERRDSTLTRLREAGVDVAERSVA